MNYRAQIFHKPLGITSVAVTAFVMGCKPSAIDNPKATIEHSNGATMETKEYGELKEGFHATLECLSKTIAA